MIRYYEIERMRMIVRRSGVVPLIEEVFRPSIASRKSAGRISPLTVENWLICLMLTAIHGKSMHSSETHQLFTDLDKSPLRVQLELGTRYRRNGVEYTVSENPFETRLRIFGSRMNSLNDLIPERPKKRSSEPINKLDQPLAPTELERYPQEILDARRELMQRISRQLLKASQPNDLDPTYAMAADGTAVESFGQFRRGGIDPDARPGYRTAKLGEKSFYFGYNYLALSRVRNIKSKKTRPEPRLFEHVFMLQANLEGGVGKPILSFILETAAKGELKNLSVDAAWHNTKAEEFAYPLQEAGVTISMAPKASMKKLEPYDGVPMYYRHALCPGTPDEVLDIARNLTRPPALTLESGYSDEELEALAKSYGEDGASVADDGILSLDECITEELQNETDESVDGKGDESTVESIKGDTAGASADPTASSTPDPTALQSKDWREYLKWLPLAERKELIKAKRFKAYRQTTEWVEKSELIEQWALVHKEKASSGNGYTDRFECPAKSGRLRCPFYAPSMAIDPEVRPLVQNPPTEGVFCTITRPADARNKKLNAPTEDVAEQMVRQFSFTLPRHVLPKLNTEFFTGTRDWIKDMQRRSSIEGIFGNLKSRAGGGLDKGWIAVGGQVQHALLGTIKMAATNIQNSQSWILNLGGETQDPVYAPAPISYGLDENTAERAEEIRNEFASPKTNAIAA